MGTSKGKKKSQIVCLRPGDHEVREDFSFALPTCTLVKTSPSTDRKRHCYAVDMDELGLGWDKVVRPH